MDRNALKIFKKIKPGWDHDLHVHSNWSQDILDGPSMEDYASLANRYKIHIGFADHFELALIKKNEKSGDWRLNLDTIDDYLEEIDNLKEEKSFFSSGLEIDYYPSRKEELHQFLDDYKNQFDFLLGSVHEVEDFRAVTIQNDLKWLIKKYGSFEDVIDEYFEILFDMVHSKLFDSIAHPDVIFRFLSAKTRKKNAGFFQEKKIIELGYQCEKTKTMMEVNLSGYRCKWNQSFPSSDIFHHLLAHGLNFSVGSDSHSLQDFKDSILNIRKANQIIKNQTTRNNSLFTKKF